MCGSDIVIHRSEAEEMFGKDRVDNWFDGQNKTINVEYQGQTRKFRVLHQKITQSPDSYVSSDRLVSVD